MAIPPFYLRIHNSTNQHIDTSTHQHNCIAIHIMGGGPQYQMVPVEDIDLEAQTSPSSVFFDANSQTEEDKVTGTSTIVEQEECPVVAVEPVSSESTQVVQINQEVSTKTGWTNVEICNALVICQAGVKVVSMIVMCFEASTYRGHTSASYAYIAWLSMMAISIMLSLGAGHSAAIEGRLSECVAQRRICKRAFRFTFLTVSLAMGLMFIGLTSKKEQISVSGVNMLANCTIPLNGTE